MLSTDILSYALSDDVKVGVTFGGFSGVSYTGSLPVDSLRYGTWEINKRNDSSVSVKCLDINQNIIWSNSYSNGSWKGWKSHLTNADIEPIQQSATKTIASATSLSTIATYTATKDENIMIGAYAGFPQNYTGIRSFGIYKGGTPIAMDKGPAIEGEGSHQSSVFANIHLNAGESVNIAVQQNSGTSLSVTFVINSTRKFTFK